MANTTGFVEEGKRAFPRYLSCLIMFDWEEE